VLQFVVFARLANDCDFHQTYILKNKLSHLGMIFCLEYWMNAKLLFEKRLCLSHVALLFAEETLNITSVVSLGYLRRIDEIGSISSSLATSSF
jgi:hypothetical protein